MKREAHLSCLIVILVFVIACSEALTFYGGNTTYAKFPKWNACINASLKFEFKSTSGDGLLMYTDDNGRYDFFQLALKGGQVRLWMNVVDEKDGVVQLVVGKNLNDGRWHSVEVKRNRMNTTLFVDSYQSSMMSFGSDFQFGDIYENNYVFFGGIPPGYENNLKGLALPSSMFETRFNGMIRNILYFNCTCIPVRAEMLESSDVSRIPKEACEKSNNCPSHCACISLDGGPGCECFETRQCADRKFIYVFIMHIQ